MRFMLAISIDNNLMYSLYVVPVYYSMKVYEYV